MKSEHPIHKFLDVLTHSRQFMTPREIMLWLCGTAFWKSHFQGRKYRALHWLEEMECWNDPAKK